MVIPHLIVRFLPAAPRILINPSSLTEQDTCFHWYWTMEITIGIRQHLCPPPPGVAGWTHFPTANPASTGEPTGYAAGSCSFIISPNWMPQGRVERRTPCW